MGIAEAAQIYTKLTIGDGLVSQIPALLISLAAGLLVTRGSESTNLNLEFIRQMFSRPEVLLVAGGFLGLLILTNLPTIPLLVLAVAFLAAAYWQRAELAPQETPPPTSKRTTRPSSAKKTASARPEKSRRVEDFLQVDPIELELGRNLLRLATPNRGGDLLNRITRTREFVASDLGLVLPSVRVRDNLSLAENQYCIRFLGNLVASNSLPKDGQIVIPPQGLKPRQLPHAREVSHPALPTSARLISADRIADARSVGCQLITASQLIADHLRHTTYELAHELLTRDATKRLLDEVKRNSPAVVDELIPHVMRLGQVQQVLQGLLREGVPIRQLPTILEALCDHRPQTDNLAELTERVRHRLARTISARYSSRDGQLHVITLDPQLEDQLAMSSGELTTEQQQSFRELFLHTVQRLTSENRPPLLLTRSEIRLAVRQLAQAILPHVIVLGHDEVTPEAQIRAVGIVGLSQY